MNNFLTSFYNAGRAFVFSQIYPAPTIFNPHTRNFIGVNQYMHLLSYYDKSLHPIECHFDGKINLISNPHFHSPDAIEGILIADLNGKQGIFNKQAQYIIYVGGNTTCFQILVPEMLAMFHKHHEKPYIMSFNPPGVGMSHGATNNIEEYCASLKLIIDTLCGNSVPAENIIVIGHSLGAAIAARAIADYQAQGKNIKLFADRTMSSISAAASAKFRKLLPTEILRIIVGAILAWIARRLVRFFAQDIDVVKDFSLINEKNPGSARAMVTEYDHMMEDCCIADALPKHQLPYLKRFKLLADDMYKRGHSKVREQLIHAESPQTAEQYLHECIENFKPSKPSF